MACGVAGRKGDTGVLTGPVEAGNESAAAVDLDGQRRVREVGPDGFEEAFGVMGGGTVVRPDHELLADGETALKSLSCLPFRERDMWSIWTSSPGCCAFSSRQRKRRMPISYGKLLRSTNDMQMCWDWDYYQPPPF